MQEDIERRSVALSFKASRLTAVGLARAISSLIRHIQKEHNAPKPGKQKVARLERTVPGKTDSIQLMGRIKSFDRIAKKHGISYSVVKDGSTDPPRWTVYFKEKQVDALQAAFGEYTAKVLGKKRGDKERPSLLGKLAEFKALAKNTAVDREKHKERGGHER